MDGDAAIGPPGPSNVPPATSRPPATPRYAVKCPDCKKPFEAGREPLDAELVCPLCGNKGFVAPGNHPQLSDAEVDRLTDEQLGAYLQHGFHVLDPRAKPAWGTGPRKWYRGAVASVLVTIIVFIATPVVATLLERGASFVFDHPAFPWLIFLVMLAGPVGMVVFGHLASRHRSGGPARIWTILGLGWFLVVVLLLVFASSFPRLLCKEELTNASWQEPGAGDALRGMGLAPTRGDPSLPFPGDEAPYLSALLQMEHAGTLAYYTVQYENASSASLKVQPYRGVEWNDTRAELAAFIQQVTGKSESESGQSANDLLAGRLSHRYPDDRLEGGTIYVSENSTSRRVYIQVQREEGTGRIPGPFRSADLYDETRGQKYWFVWTWVTRSMTLIGDEGQRLGTLDYQGNGFVVAGLHGTSEEGLRESVERAFAAARLPPPAFKDLQTAASSCD